MLTKFNVAGLQAYIQAISRLPRPERKAEGALLPFITISRQAGAGGHSLAEALLRAMARHPRGDIFKGWQILDQELCKKVLEDPQLHVSLESLLTEKFTHGVESFLSETLVKRSPQITVFHRIAKLVRTFASLGKVIIVGRAGCLLTRDLPLGTHVRLVASKQNRVQVMMRQFNLSREAAQKQVREQDASRALLVRTYFSDRDVADPLLYDAVWNTDHVPIPKIASFLVDLIADKHAAVYPEKVRAAIC